MFWPVVVILVVNLQVQAVVTDTANPKGYLSARECQVRLNQMLESIAHIDSQTPVKVLSARCDQKA